MPSDRLDDLMDQRASGAPDVEPDALDSLMDDYVNGRKQAVAGQLTQAIKVNPEQYANQRRVAEYLGYPPAAVEALPELQEQAKVRQVQSNIAQSPALQRRYTDADFAKLAHDDSDVLSQIAGFFRDTGGSVKAGTFNASRGAAGLFRSGFEFVAPVLDFLEPATAIGGNPLRRVAEGFDIQAQNAGAIAKAATPQTDGILSSGFQSGIQSLTQNLLMLPMAFAPGGQGAALAGMTSTTGGNAYQDAREKGLTMSQALPFAASQAAIEYATEKLPLSRLIGDVKAGTPFFQMLTRQVAAEVPGEQVATVLQDLNEWAVLNPEKPFSAYLEERPSAAAQTLVATIVGSGGNVAVVKGLEKMLGNGLNSAKEIESAEASAKTLEQGLAAVLNSKLRERNPGTFKELIDEMAADTEGAPKSVFIDAQVLMQSATPEELLQLLPSVAGQLQEAAAANAPVEIPISEVLTSLPGTPLEKVFIENARANENALSLADAKAASEQAGEFLKQEADRVLAEATDQQAWQNETDKVKNIFTEQLNAAGRFTPEQNEVKATLASQLFSTLAARSNMTPEQFYARYPLRVVGQMPGQGAPVLRAGGQEVDAALDAITGPDLEDDQVFSRPLPEANDESLGYLSKIGASPIGTGGVHLSVRGGEVKEAGPHEFFFHDNDDQPVGFARLTKNAKQASINMIAFAEGSRGNGYGKSFYKYLLDDLGLEVKSDKEITDGTAALYRSLAAEYPVRVDSDGRVVVSPKGELSQSATSPDAGTQALVDAGILRPVGKSAKGRKVYRAIAPGEAADGPRGAGMWVTPDRDIALNVYARGNESQVVEDYIPERDLYEVHPGGWIYAPKGTDTLSIKRTADMTLGEMLQQGRLNQSVDQTQTPEFKAWFGDSKVVDDQGKPLVVYHGRGGDFAEFNTQGGGGKTFNTGAFFTDKADVAATYATGEMPNVAPTFLSLKTPLVVDAGGANWSQIAQKARVEMPEIEVATAGMQGDENLLAELEGRQSEKVKPVKRKAKKTNVRELFKGEWDYPDDTASTDDIARWARKQGYDGLIIRNVQDHGPSGRFATDDKLSNIYVAFRPEQIKSAIGNRGTFDPASPHILEQGPRGTFSPSQLLISIGENGDLTTFEHELAHFSLEVMAGLASQPGAPQQIVDDMNKLLSWFGVPDLATWNGYTLDQKRPHHERLAESMEQYFFEGKAPSAELQPVFRRLRSWFLQAYKSLKDFMDSRNLGLNDDVRQVFDRMLATDEQIAEAEQAAGMLPDFDATNEAIEKLQARSLRDMKWMVNTRNKALKKLQKQAADTRKGVESEVRAEVEAMQEMRAKTALRDFRKTNKRAPNDTELAVIADSTDYASAEEMLAAIDAFGDPKDVVEGMTDQRMLERYGDLVDERAMQEAANEAVHNEVRARALATELKGQADAMNPRQQVGTASNGRAVTVNALVEAAKQFGQNLAARRKLKDLRAATAQHRAAERRAGKRWQDATTSGNTQDAVQAKRDQLLNNYTVKALQDAQAEVKKAIGFFRKVTKDSNEKLVDKGRDPDVVNAMRAILAAYGVAPRLEKSALEYMEAVAKNDPAMYGALKPGVDAALFRAMPLNEMTIEELRGLTDELQAMWSLAKRSRQMEVDGNLLDIQDAADELVARMQEIGVPDEVPGEKGSITAREEAGIKLQFAKAILRRVEQWSEGLDGKFGGPFLRLVFQPIKDAADRYRTDRVNYREKFTALVKKVGPDLPPGAIAAPELGYTFGNARDSGMAEVQHAILHTGNESNKRKLLLGRGWATENADGTLDTSRWDAFLQRLATEGKLKPSHYDFAQGVWDLLDQMKPLAQDTHRKVFGRYFSEVTSDTFTDPFGAQRRGGYAPAQTDSRLVSDAKLRELAEGENESMAYAFPSSPSGFTKARVEYNKPLLLDLRALAQHMDKVLLFSHMQGAVTDVRRLLTQKNVSYALNRIDPGAYEGMLMPWLNRSAKQIVETPVMGDRKISRFLSAARSRAGMALMFANLSNTVQQLTGFSMAAVKVKPSLMMAATGEFVRNPKALKANVVEKSDYMRNRMLNEVTAMNDAVEEILVNPTLLEKGQAWTQRHAYFMQAAVDNTMSPIIWTAAYNQAIAEGKTDKDAVRFADSTVRQTQGTTLPEDISRFESGPAWGRLFTQFVSYFNMMANTNGTAVKQIVDEMGLRKGAGKVLYVALAGLLVPIWVAESIALAFRGGPEDDEEDGYLDDWLMAVFGMGTLRGLTAQVPIAGQGAQLVANRFNDNPADDKFSLSPAVSLIESAVSAPASVYNAIVEDGNMQKAIKDLAAAATMVTGLPIYAAARPVGYAAGAAQGKIEPTSAADAARGLVTGTASPESKGR
jgi:hypothetical protein